MSEASDAKPKLDTCGCCAAAPEPAAIYNPPGQPVLAYRIGTYSRFFAHMLQRLPSQGVTDAPTIRPLAGLTTRDTDDPAIALLDAWAIVGDVLTFYQERIANEGYLRTAAERRSVLELARQIGYELNPGVAASTLLAFTIQVAPATALPITVAAGTKVQSVPAPGKLPQTFETIEDIPARPEWNAIRPRLSRPQTLAGHMDSIWFDGTATGLKPGDAILIVTANDQTLRRAAAVTPDTDAKVTRVDLVPLSPSFPSRLVAAVNPRVFELVASRIGSTAARSPAAFAFSAGAAPAQRMMLAGALAQPAARPLALRRSDLGAIKASLGSHLGAVLGGIGGIVTWGGGAAPQEQTGAFAMRERAAIFGYNAPTNSATYYSLVKYTDPTDPKTAKPLYPAWDDPELSVWVDPMSTSGDYYADADLYLDGSIPGVLPNSWIVLEMPGGTFGYYRVQAVAEGARTGFALSGKATGLTLWTPEGNSLGTGDKTDAFTFRKTTVYCRSESLTLARSPVIDDIAGISIDLETVWETFHAGQKIIVTGELSGQPGVTASEAATIFDIYQNGAGADAYTTVLLAAELTNSYARKTVTINANVALATHGETVREVLGSGDSSLAHQSFILKKPPLTYVSAPTPSGGRSTLAVSVNGTTWSEAPSLYGLGPRSENYIVRLDNDGKPTITFGDGRSGERLPTGVENVTAVYRSGIGPDGEVGAGSLTLLQTQPFGVRGVTNPLAASGAAAPEQLDDARANAPLKVLTLDRVVSLEDYEDFARAFAGIGKARAVALWSGERRLVHITVAGATGKEIDPSSPLLAALQTAIAEFGDPVQQVRIAGFAQRTFSVEATVIVDPRRTTDRVLGAVEAAMRDAFSFARRDFAQPVTGAEVVSVAQAVDGVIAVNLQSLAIDSPALILSLLLPSILRTAPGLLARFGTRLLPALRAPLRFPHFVLPLYQPPVDRVLPARPARWENGAIQPAELLVINPDGITLHGKNP